MQAKEMPHMPRSVAKAETLICTAERWSSSRDHKSTTTPHSALHLPLHMFSKMVTSSAELSGHFEGSPGERSRHDLGLNTSHEIETLGHHCFRVRPSNVTPKRRALPKASGAAMVSLSKARLSGMRITCSRGDTADDSEAIHPLTSSETSDRRRTHGWWYANRSPHLLVPFWMACWRST